MSNPQTNPYIYAALINTRNALELAEQYADELKKLDPNQVLVLPKDLEGIRSTLDVLAARIQLWRDANRQTLRAIGEPPLHPAPPRAYPIVPESQRPST